MAQEAGIKLTKNDLPNLVAAIQALTTSRVAVGVPATQALRKPEPGEKGDVNNAMLAYIHENGCPAANIPPRPFLKPTIEFMRANIAAQLRQIAVNGLKGRLDAVERGFHILGLKVSTAVKMKINTGPFQKLADATIARRRARGRMGTKPLLDTGQLRNAITYVIKRVRGISQLWS